MSTIKDRSVIFCLLALLAAASFALAGCTTMQKEIDQNTERTEVLEAQSAEHSEKIMELEEQVTELEETAEEQVEEISSTIRESETKRRFALKIKVLTGDNNLPYAKEVAAMLEDNDYSVRYIDFNFGRRFKETTVYYAHGLEPDAQELAGVLGDEPVMKPLTWNSIFDIIVVTAK